MLAGGSTEGVREQFQSIAELILICANNLLNLLLVQDEIELREGCDAESLHYWLILFCLHCAEDKLGVCI